MTGDSSRTRIGDRRLAPESLMMSYGYDPRLSEGAIKPPIFHTSTFVFESAEEVRAYNEGRTGKFLYTRYGNPTVAAAEATRPARATWATPVARRTTWPTPVAAPASIATTTAGAATCTVPPA